MDEVIRHPRYTLRMLDDGEGPIDQGAVAIVRAVLDAGYRLHEVDGHLFVTMVPCVTFAAVAGPEVTDDDIYVGAYTQGYQSMQVAGWLCDELTVRHQQEVELAVTVGHEFMHYVQDREGRLTPDGDCEPEAEREGRALASICGYVAESD